MEIGRKLKEARQMSGLTQENVAEKLNVSRQTISNWETEKFYPDILYVLQLSDLYQVSLDELLKGDERMIQHLENSTNVVKSNQKILLAFICNICLLFLFFIFIIPISKSYLLTLIGLLVVTNGLFVYQLFKLVELDSAVRGMKHPKFWGVLAAGGQRGEGLILYLLNRNKAVFSMTEEEKEELQMRKQRIIYLLVLIMILVIFLFASVIVRF